ncbi:hypothetical protein KPH14_003844 [Odynerus spinipes]|uniref:Thioesterase domain-containing protein n=1 Tax=Odynerus spinipes TaxID=1348599 RepID=A0AAD9VVR6_9HYME|nr:hypothetical protein KPH14_003844 [Odynerus spinipes]
MARGVEFIRNLVKHLVTTNTHGKCMKNVNILSAESGRCKAEFEVSEEHTNLGGSLHGGFTATVVDCVSTYALMTNEKNSPGVSVDMHISYMKPAFPGEVVTVDAKTIRVGRSMAFLTVELTKNNGKDVIAFGQHTKFIG